MIVNDWTGAERQQERRGGECQRWQTCKDVHPWLHLQGMIRHGRTAAAAADAAEGAAAAAAAAVAPVVAVTAAEAETDAAGAAAAEAGAAEAAVAGAGAGAGVAGAALFLLRMLRMLRMQMLIQIQPCRLRQLGKSLSLTHTYNRSSIIADGPPFTSCKHSWRRQGAGSKAQ